MIQSRKTRKKFATYWELIDNEYVQPWFNHVLPQPVTVSHPVTLPVLALCFTVLLGNFLVVRGTLHSSLWLLPPNITLHAWGVSTLQYAPVVLGDVAH